MELMFYFGIQQKEKYMKTIMKYSKCHKEVNKGLLTVWFGSLSKVVSDCR